MKQTLLFIAFIAVSSFAIGQTKDAKTDEKPLRKIASGNGAKQIEEEVQQEVAEAMRDLRIELKDIDVRVNRGVLRGLEGLDEQIEESLEGLDEEIERSVEESLEGLDEQIDESVEHSLRSLEHLDLDFDFDFDIDTDMDLDVDVDADHHGNHHRDIEEFRKEALRDDAKDAKDVKDLKKDESKKDESKKAPKKKD